MNATTQPTPFASYGQWLESIEDSYECRECNGFGEVECCECGQDVECKVCDGEGVTDEINESNTGRLRSRRRYASEIWRDFLLCYGPSRRYELLPPDFWLWCNQENERRRATAAARSRL